MRSLLFISGIAAFLGTVAAEADTRPPDLPNYHQVDDRVYRGGQPTEDGFRTLSKAGVRTVIDLRPDGEDGTHSVRKESDMVEAAGMRYISIPMKGLSGPTPDAVSKILHLMNSEADGPVFIHCRRGADRTGTVVACYRMQHDHWSNQAALREAVALGMSWVELGMKHFVSNFQPQALPGPSVPAFSPPADH